MKTLSYNDIENGFKLKEIILKIWKLNPTYEDYKKNLTSDDIINLSSFLIKNSFIKSIDEYGGEREFGISFDNEHVRIVTGEMYPASVNIPFVNGGILNFHCHPPAHYNLYGALPENVIELSDFFKNKNGMNYLVYNGGLLSDFPIPSCNDFYLSEKALAEAWGINCVCVKNFLVFFYKKIFIVYNTMTGEIFGETVDYYDKWKVIKKGELSEYGYDYIYGDSITAFNYLYDATYSFYKNNNNLNEFKYEEANRYYVVTTEDGYFIYMDILGNIISKIKFMAEPIDSKKEVGSNIGTMIHQDNQGRIIYQSYQFS